MIIVADANGAEVRSLLFTEYDFEIGDTENSFLVTCALNTADCSSASRPTRRTGLYP